MAFPREYTDSSDAPRPRQGDTPLRSAALVNRRPSRSRHPPRILRLLARGPLCVTSRGVSRHSAEDAGIRTLARTERRQKTASARREHGGAWTYATPLTSKVLRVRRSRMQPFAVTTHLLPAPKQQTINQSGERAHHPPHTNRPYSIPDQNIAHTRVRVSASQLRMFTKAWREVTSWRGQERRGEEEERTHWQRRGNPVGARNRAEGLSAGGVLGLQLHYRALRVREGDEL
ncbi:hypothetical protein DFH09DRAFT_1094326 [Mycena vulgaris]|nr:hypothetical protein DFH09DRAFT_1094326 [Mycena vulgaris]